MEDGNDISVMLVPQPAVFPHWRQMLGEQVVPVEMGRPSSGMGHCAHGAPPHLVGHDGIGEKVTRKEGHMPLSQHGDGSSSQCRKGKAPTHLVGHDGMGKKVARKEGHMLLSPHFYRWCQTQTSNPLQSQTH